MTICWIFFVISLIFRVSILGSLDLSNRSTVTFDFLRDSWFGDENSPFFGRRFKLSGDELGK